MQTKWLLVFTAGFTIALAGLSAIFVSIFVWSVVDGFGNFLELFLSPSLFTVEVIILVFGPVFIAWFGVFSVLRAKSISSYFVRALISIFLSWTFLIPLYFLVILGL